MSMPISPTWSAIILIPRPAQPSLVIPPAIIGFMVPWPLFAVPTLCFITARLPISDSLQSQPSFKLLFPLERGIMTVGFPKDALQEASVRLWRTIGGAARTISRS